MTMYYTKRIISNQESGSNTYQKIENYYEFNKLSYINSMQNHICKKNIKCTMCNKIYSSNWLSKIINYYGKWRGYFNGNVIEIDNQHYDDPLYICANCLETIGYHIIPRCNYCDLCHSAHAKIYLSDIQCNGLCGVVTYKGPLLYRDGIFPVREQDKTKYIYTVNCGYGSKHDTCYDYDIVFVDNKLPDHIQVGMNLCDSCITKMLNDHILYDPTYKLQSK